MGRVEKISVALTPELAATVRDAVASGDYASTSEIVREALRGWRDMQKEKVLIAEVRALVAEADASGYRDGPPNFDAIIANGRRKLAERSK